MDEINAIHVDNNKENCLKLLEHALGLLKQPFSCLIIFLFTHIPIYLQCTLSISAHSFASFCFVYRQSSAPTIKYRTHPRRLASNR